VKSKSSKVSLIQLDEAFIDFWSDALLDPISSDWPAFIICKLKPCILDGDAADTSLGWLVIEQMFSKSGLSSTAEHACAARKDQMGTCRISCLVKRR
jgi:hypothetical protein